MKIFTFKKERVGNSLFAQSSFKSFIVLVVMMIMTTASAMAEVVDGLNYKFDSVSKTAILLSNTDRYSGDIIVPEKVKCNDGIEYTVVALGDKCFYDCYDLTSITIPTTVKSFGGCCFSGCSSLTSITIPSSIKSIEGSCFLKCTSLTSITIPSSVTSLGTFCLSGCTSLTSIHISSSVSSLKSGCFSNCKGLTSVIIPSSVKLLERSIFDGCDNLKTIYFEGELPISDDYNNMGIPNDCVIKVPEKYFQDYKKAFDLPYYYSISTWNPDESGDDDKPVTPCATPSVSYESGKLKFACETTGAKYNYTITDTDITSDALNENGEVSLSAAYNISVYATADGYSPSEKAEATLYWINANLETANINLAKTRGIVASAHDGIVSISGLDNGEVVKFYAADGKLLGSSSAVGGVASCAVSEKMIIAKIGMDTIKVLMK